MNIYDFDKQETDGWFGVNPVYSDQMQGSQYIPFTFTVSPYYEVDAGGIPSWKNSSSLPGPWLRKWGGKDYSTEKQLFRSLVTEAYNHTGVTLDYYITTYDTTYDTIWGEDCDRRFVRRFPFQARYKLPDEMKMWSKFAIEGLDNFAMYISKDHFRVASTLGNTLVKGDIGVNSYDPYIPQIGDIVISLFNNMIYEIRSVREVAMRYHLDDHYVWEFQVAKYVDEQIGFSSASSASMSFISAYSNVGSADIFNVAPSAVSNYNEIKYQPPATEEVDNWPSSVFDPF